VFFAESPHRDWASAVTLREITMAAKRLEARFQLAPRPHRPISIQIVLICLCDDLVRYRYCKMDRPVKLDAFNYYFAVRASTSPARFFAGVCIVIRISRHRQRLALGRLRATGRDR